MKPQKFVRFGLRDPDFTIVLGFGFGTGTTTIRSQF
jgi:hypothetical protein